MKIKLTLEYDGTNFAGYQIQPEKRTVQGELEKALYCIYNEKVPTFAAGRTDAGVHALGAVVHFTAPKQIKNKRIRDAINAFMPVDAKVVKAEEVDDSFDARFTSKTKTYGYFFYRDRCERPLLFGRALRVNDDLDIEAMREGAKYLVGEHDYGSFVSKKSGKTNFVRTIYSADIKQIGEEEYMFVVSGNGFLYNQIRIIMGTLLNVGYRKYPPSKVKEILDAKERKQAGKTAAACGLYLLKVEY